MAKKVGIKVIETQKTTHELICFTVDAQDREIWVDVAKNEKGELMNLTFGADIILYPLQLAILAWLKEQGKI